ncbi:MAG: DUF1285 domain-containing protein [Rhodobiaceae bacterium]|jgi:hypothetical protein|nr:DUF1285 domain-containing protein [Rhodobiaceae bacterium]MBT5517978.1 DUF1285 domain-containing protein [Rhodobiaceae bacterium]MBT7280192.1 DUF1285 domain-containing protein [Rhodobiaceae bacterium]
MSEKANKDATAEAANALLKVIADAEKAGENKQTGEKGLPPVHLWEPDYCGDIGMKIARDGQWYYANSPIGRKKLVRLFSTILRHDEDGEHYLVSPVEKIRVEVEDAPFVATLMHVSGEGQAQVLRFETNVGDFTEAGPEHPLRFEIDAQTGEPSPYIHVRARLEALISRAVFYDLVALCEVVDAQFGVWSHGVFFALAAAEDVQTADDSASA